MINVQTCFKEIGNVNLPETSGNFTISFMISLQLLQTPAQATTLFREGQTSSEASILISTSLKSSGGKLTQQICFKASIAALVPDLSTSKTTENLYQNIPNPSK